MMKFEAHLPCDQLLPYIKYLVISENEHKSSYPVLPDSLTSFGKKRYMELHRLLAGIGTKMLSKELQELEINGLLRGL